MALDSALFRQDPYTCWRSRGYDSHHILLSPQHLPFIVCSTVFLMKEKHFCYGLMSIPKMRKWKTRKSFTFPESRWEASLSFTHICWLHSPNYFLSLRYLIDSSFLLQLCPLRLQPGRIPTIEEDGTLQDCRRPSIFPGHPSLAPPLAPFQLPWGPHGEAPGLVRRVR